MGITTTNLFNNGIEIYEAAGDSLVHEEGENPQVTWKFIIRGASEASEAYNAFMSFLTSNFQDASGAIASYDIPLNSVKITTTDSNYIYEAEASFSFRNVNNDNEINEPTWTLPEIQENDYTFSTVGGTSHITHSLKTLGAINFTGGEIRNFNNGVGWNGDSFDGVDIITPKTEFSISCNFPQGYFDTAYRLKLADATGSINSDPWNGFEAGCVLFKGVTARPQSFNYTDAYGNNIKDWYWRATYSFEASPSVTLSFPQDTPEEPEQEPEQGGQADPQEPEQDPEQGGQADPQEPEQDPEQGGQEPEPPEPLTLVKRGFDVVWRCVEKEENTETHELEVKFSQINVEQVYKEFDFAELGLPLPD